MKISLSNLWQKINSYFCLDKLSWIFLVVGLTLNLSLWLIWVFGAKYNILIAGFASGVLVANLTLAILLVNKDKIVSYLLLGGSILVQVIVLTLLKYTLFIG